MAKSQILEQQNISIMKVPSNGIVLIWLQELDDQSTFASSPNIFDNHDNLALSH
jgi:hypothetical protein